MGAMAMRQDLEMFRDKVSGYSREQLLSLILSQHEELCELKVREAANTRIYADAHSQFLDLKDKYDTLLEEYRKQGLLLEKEVARNAVHNKNTFGRGSESLDSLVGTADDPETSDPVAEDGCDNDTKQKRRKSRIISFQDRQDGKDPCGAQDRTGHAESKKKRRTGGKTTRWIEGLPRETIYDLDIEKLNQEYGAYNWRIAYWEKYDTVEKMPSLYYNKRVYVPVISVGLEHDLRRLPYGKKLLPGSYLSESLLSSLMHGKHCLGLPYYRQSAELCRQGLPVTRQTMISWNNRFAPELFGPVYDYLISYIVRTGYNQCDETTTQVNKDGRKPGSKSYMWIHVTGEHYTGHPAVIFSFELTRGTGHLRRFYQDFIGYITCDAYISYQVLESENPERIMVTGCMMHCRRYFAIAFFLHDISSMTDEEVLELPEMKILRMIGKIYSLEKPLKEVSADERLAARRKEILPKMDGLFDYINELLKDEACYSERMRQALHYAVNQKQYLYRFLEDGTIALDNGLSERSLRGYCIGRRSWLFSDTIDGAEATAIIYSMTETAKLNQADPQLYLQYLLEKMPVYMDSVNRDFLDDMLPWSDRYREYESSQKAGALRQYGDMFAKPERPRTPRKRELQLIS